MENRRGACPAPVRGVVAIVVAPQVQQAAGCERCDEFEIAPLGAVAGLNQRGGAGSSDDGLTIHFYGKWPRPLQGLIAPVEPQLGTDPRDDFQRELVLG